MLKGSCLCGGIQYQYDGEITELSICHCNQCKRAQGTPFVTNAPINSASFKVTAGADLLKAYVSSPDKSRVFCSNCGSPLFSQRADMPDTIRLRVGTVTDGTIPQPDYQKFCQSISDWCVLNDAKPKYQQKKA